MTVPADPYLIEIRLRRDEVPGYSEYPFCLDAVRHLETLELHPSVTYFVGENGSGKSTLLEAVAVAVAYEDTEHFQVTRSFLNGRERMLKELMS